MEEILISKSDNQIDTDYIKKNYNNWELKINFLFESDFVNAKLLRDATLLILDTLGFQSIWKSRFTLIIDELNNNSIEYWSNSWEINSMKVHIKNQNNSFEVNIEVEDTWNWKSSKKASEMELLRETRIQKGFQNHDSIRWRWLFLIITKLVDKLYFKDSEKWGLIVGITKTIEL